MPEVLTLYQLAERLGLKVNWLRDQARSGRIPYLSASNRMLFNPAAVTEALARMAAQYPGATQSEVIAHAAR